MRFKTTKQLKKFLDKNGFKRTEINDDKWVMASCPFHNDENPSFGIEKDKLRGHCFKCGWFSWEDIADRLGIKSFKKEFIVGMKSDEWNEVKGKLVKKKSDTINFYKLPFSYPILKCKKQLEYMLNRGFEKRILKLFDIRVGLSGRYKGRVILPVKDTNGEVVFFDARSIKNNKKKKYIRPWGSPVWYYLGGIDIFWKYGKDFVVVVEGYLDMLKLWQYGVPAVCTFGAKMSFEQIKLLLRKNLNYIVLGFDNDEAGNHAAELANHYLDGSGAKVERLRLEEGVDPGDIKKDDLFKMNNELKKQVIFFSCE